jgi:2-haloacid dehalogenase
MTAVRAMFFDVFGTLVDWRTSVAREAERILDPGHKLDWPLWMPGEVNTSPMEDVRSGASRFAGWTCAPAQSRTLYSALRSARLSEDVLSELMLAASLDAWPDGGAQLLQENFSGARVSSISDSGPCPRNEFLDANLGGNRGDSNRNHVSILLHAGRSISPQQCMMIAAHSNDLAAAAACGLRIGHTARPNEYGPDTGERTPTVKVDVSGKDLSDLAGKVGA